MNEAPARISMIMQVTRVAPITPCQNECHDSAPCHQAMASEPSTPQAAHSVAVAQPSISERNTNAISSRQGMRLRDSEIFFRHDIGGSAGGVFSGWMSDQST